jgi:hypothetical protein
MTEIKIYTIRQGCNAYLPRDVLDAVGAPANDRQGRMFVWATTATMAMLRLESLNLGPLTHRELGEAHGHLVDTLASWGWDDGTVLATANTGYGLVVHISPPNAKDGPSRVLRTVGELVYGVVNFRPAADLEPQVTDAMVEAADDAIQDAGVCKWEIDPDQIRIALTAALKVQRSTS